MQPETLKQLGFYFGTSGAHASRALMLDELRVLLEHAPAAAVSDWYSHAIVQDNLLAKATLNNRVKVGRYLRQLYGLDERICLFRNFRRLWRADAPSRPVLAVLLAMARDALFRKSAELIVATPFGAAVTAAAVRPLLDGLVGGRMSKETLRLAADNVLTSWERAGYLTDGKPRLRVRPAVGPAACAFALFLGWLEGARGAMLFGTRWAQMLGLPSDELIVLAGAAARNGFMELLHAGGVIEVRFPGYLNGQEAKLQ